MWEGIFPGEPFTLSSTEPMDFEFLDHDEALSVFKSPRPSDTLDELEKLAVRERLLKETGDYPPGFPFRFETHNTFSLEDLRSRPITAIPEAEGGGFSDNELDEDLSDPPPNFSGHVEDNPWKAEDVDDFDELDDEEAIEETSRY